jgi:simple sugar transport system ATP-binding protein
VKNIHKIYPDGTYALNDVSFAVQSGEIHGLVGENGAGKSTLMRILFGSIAPSQGQIYVNDEETVLHDPSDAIGLGIGMVHQKFALINSFTVTENIILGAEPNQAVILDQEKNDEIIQRLAQDTGLLINPKAMISSLSIGEKQRVEILKMLYRGASILILDEPTSVLTPVEVKDFFTILLRLKQQGSTIIFVTHKLREVLEICDRVTVIRKGKVVGVTDIQDASPEQLARMMVGRNIAFQLSKTAQSHERIVMAVKNIVVLSEADAIAVNDLTFHLKAGEILGIVGVEGNGQAELVEAVTGLRRSESGSITILDQNVTELTSRAIKRLGVAHIPADKDTGLVGDLNIEENLILGFHEDQPYSTGYRLNQQTIMQFALEAISEYNIQVPSHKAQLKYLSGGNQQRVVVARELSHKPQVIVAAQPTRGLDVASTEYVRSILLRMREQGKGILLVTTDLDEAIQLSDRLAIMYDGSFIDIVDPNDVSEEQLGLMMGGHTLREGGQ